MPAAVHDALFGMPAADAVTMLAALWDALVAEGLPLARTTVALRTLHPNVFGLGYVWEPGKPVKQNEHSFLELARPRFLNSPLREVFAGRGPIRVRLDGDAPLPFPSLDELRARGLRDYLALPLTFTDGELHAWTVAAGEGFSEAHLARLAEVAPMLATALEVRETRRIARMLLDTYVGARAGARVLAGRIRRGDVEIIDAVLMCCDLRGFTALSADVTPEAVVAALSGYFQVVCAPIVAAGGEILKFIGDGLLVGFPIDDRAQLPAICARTLAATRQALADLEQADNVDLPAQYLPLRAGASLHVGRVAFGNVGARDRLDFTVIGAAVNLAARLAGLCPVLKKSVLASTEFAAQVPAGARSLGWHTLHGLPAPVEVMSYE